ncbi:MAG: restriction endonuclease subunit S [Kiritimatiellia bacterium]|nr:restriction endonuclease subunit S [Kiritimatiellia bacterium]
MTAPRTSALGDIAEFVRGINFKPDDVVPEGTPGTVLCMRTKNVQTELDLSDVWRVGIQFVKRDDQYLQAGDILVSSANSWNLVGKCCWIPELREQASFGGFVSVLRAFGEKVEPRYLFRWFASDRVQTIVRSFGQQTTNISNLNIDRCLKLPVPLPPLPEQRRIADVLDRAEALRAKRRAALDELDELTQSIFLDMFGDPVTNPKGWAIKLFKDVGTLDRGVSKHRPRNAPELLGGPYPLVQTGEVSNCDGYIRSHVSTYSESGLRQSKMWPAGTLCITIAANIAKTGILTFPSCFPDSVVGFSSEHTATTEFIRIWLSFLQKTLEDSAPESAQKNINLAILRNLKLPFPPLALQREFAGRVAAVERLKAAQRASLAELDELFASLQHRAFRGEL